MRRVALAITAGVAGCTLSLAAAPTAHAASDVVATNQGWYSALTLDAGESVIDPVAANTLTTEDLPVGAVGAQEHKRSYLLLGFPAGTTDATITLERSSSPGSNFGPAGHIFACPLVAPFEVTSGDSLERAPQVDCGDEPVVGTVAELGTGETDLDAAYSFDLRPLVSAWNAGLPYNGIALVADTSTQNGYQVTFTVPSFSVVGAATVGAASDSVASAPASGADPALSSGVAGGPGFAPRLDFLPIQSMGPQPGPEPPGSGPVVAEVPVTDDVGTRVALPVPVIPLPINAAVWLLFPAGLGFLVLSARGLGKAGQPSSQLDRLLPSA